MSTSAPAPRIDAGTRTGAVHLTVADLDRGDIQPVESRVDSDALVLSVPPVKHWSILIIEANARTPP